MNADELARDVADLLSSRTTAQAATTLEAIVERERAREREALRARLDRALALARPRHRGTSMEVAAEIVRSLDGPEPPSKPRGEKPLW